MSDVQRPVEVFISYAPKDKSFYLELEKHLKLLQNDGLITTWHEWQISAGMDRTKTLDQYLNTASIFLLLVSPDFFASNSCYGTETQRALERYDAGEAHVILI